MAKRQTRLGPGSALQASNRSGPNVLNPVKYLGGNMSQSKQDNPIKKQILKEMGLKPISTAERAEDTTYISFLETDEYILEEIKNATLATPATHSSCKGNYSFIKFSKLTGEAEVMESVEHLGKVYCPIVDGAAEKGGVTLPSGVMEYGSTDKLVKELTEFIYENCEVPSFFEKFLPHVILFYWVYERFPFIPYLHFVGGTSTGKTTAMETLGSISYKSIDTTGSLTIASLFRIATTWKGTMLIDEFDHLGDRSGEIVSFLKSGVSDRLIFRTEGETKKEVKAYLVKSPKIFTSENPIDDAGLQSRTFVVRMQKNKRRLPLYKLDDYHSWAESLRNKLLLWRLRNFNKIDLKEIRYGFPELEAFDRRVQQIVTPIYYFSEEGARSGIIDFARQQQEETLRERRESLEGQIFQTLLDSNQTTVPLSFVHNVVNKGKVTHLISERKLGNIVRKILGFDIQRLGHENISTILIDKDLLPEMCKYYGLLGKERVADVASVAEPEQNATDYINQLIDEQNNEPSNE